MRRRLCILTAAAILATLALSASAWSQQGGSPNPPPAVQGEEGQSFPDDARDFVKDNIAYFVAGLLAAIIVLLLVVTVMRRRGEVAVTETVPAPPATTPASGSALPNEKPAPAKGETRRERGRQQRAARRASRDEERKRRAGEARQRKEEKAKLKSGNGARRSEIAASVEAEKEAAKTRQASAEAVAKPESQPKQQPATASTQPLRPPGSTPAPADAEAGVRRKVEQIRAEEEQVRSEAERRLQEAERSQREAEERAVRAQAGQSQTLIGSTEAAAAATGLPLRPETAVDELAAELQASEQRLKEEREARDAALNEAHERLRKIEQRAETAERRAASAERMARLKAEEADRERRLREMLDDVAQAEQRARDAERRATAAELATAQAVAPRADAGPEQPLPSEPAAAAEPVKSEGEINLNTATFDQLRGEGLSVTQATRVLAYRERLGGYKTVEDLADVPGFPQDLLEGFKRRATV